MDAMEHYYGQHMPIGHTYVVLDWDTGLARVSRRWPNGWITSESGRIPGCQPVWYWSEPCNPEDWGTIGKTGGEVEPQTP